MFLPETYGVAFAMMFVTMICWGTWANMQKIAKWRFELFYWDFSFGVLVLTLITAFTMGSFGPVGESFINYLGDADASHYLMALVSGVIFCIANFLLVAAIAMAGMSVAFPVGIGISIVVGTFLNYAITPKGSLAVITVGVAFIIVAIVLDALAYRRIPDQEPKNVKRGLVISICCGILMGTFYPFLAAAMGTPQASGLPEPGYLEPYTASVVFAVGLVITTIVLLPVMMRKPITGEAPVAMSEYRHGSTKYHIAGLVGGGIWAIGTVFNLVASTVAGPAIAFAFGQGATLIAALMGVFVWKEFKGAQRVAALLTVMFVCFVIGLVLIGLVAPDV